jgi:hypothetical protein
MLARSHRDSLTRDGYAVLSGLVPDRLLTAGRDVICSFISAELDRPETWYRHEPLVWSIVPVHHAQAFWDIRQWPALHDTFAEIWKTEKLWVTMDRGIFKVPESEAHPDHVDESVLHWDLDLRATSATTYQGMLFFTDAARGEGSFECVPSIFRDLDRYLREHPGPVSDIPVDVAGHGVVEVPARAGDLVIWDGRLPHQGGRNRGVRPRVSLAVSMHPEGTDTDRQERIECWKRKRAPAWWRGWKGQIDPEPGGPAELNPLGRRLVGVDRWP